MNAAIPLALFGWVPLMLAVFSVCRPRTAVLVSIFGAWLFLPMATYEFSGFPDYDKFRAATVAVLLGLVIFESDRVLAQRWSLWDLPMVVWVFCPFMASISGGFGAYEGVSQVVATVLSTGFAYVVGRVYFSDREGQRELVKAFVIAGLLYVPLCLFEMRMSPQLHNMVYGFQQHDDFQQTMRMGGWRPMVFMQHGLAVALFMSSAAVVAVWMWMTGDRRHIGHIPMALIAFALLVVAVLCKSMFAMALLALGLGIILVVRYTRWWAPILVLAMVPPIYAAGRVTGLIDGQSILAQVEPVAGEQAGSLASRIQSEEVLIPASMRSPIWGVGRWDSLVTDEMGNRIDEAEVGHRAVADAFWVVTLAGRGFVGLAALLAVFFIPILAFVQRAMREGRVFMMGPAPVLALVVTMHACDNLLNAMYSPVFWMMASGLIGMLGVRGPRLATQAPVQRTFYRRAGAWS